MIKNEKRKKCNKGNNTDSPCDNYSTKLLVPRNGTNVEESKNIEKRANLLYNIIM